MNQYTTVQDIYLFESLWKHIWPKNIVHTANLKFKSIPQIFLQMGTAYNIRKAYLEAPQLYKPRLFFEKKKNEINTFMESY